MAINSRVLLKTNNYCAFLKKKKLIDIGCAAVFKGLEITFLDGFSRGQRVKDIGCITLSAANQLDSKVYAQTHVDKSNTALFQMHGFYGESRKAPILLEKTYVQRDEMRQNRAERNKHIHFQVDN